MARTFYALTTYGGDWWIVAIGPDKDAVRNEAEHTICGEEWDQPKDIYVSTQLSNLRVVSRTTALRTRAWRDVIRAHEEEWHETVEMMRELGSDE